MPKAVERKLRATARRKGLKGARVNAYIYGTMNKLGMLQQNRKKRRKKRRGY